MEEWQPLNGKLTINHTDGLNQEISEWVNGKRHGTYSLTSLDSPQQEEDGKYYRGEKHGTFRTWIDGVLVCEKVYNHGELVSEAKCPAPKNNTRRMARLLSHLNKVRPKMSKNGALGKRIDAFIKVQPQ